MVLEKYAERLEKKGPTPLCRDQSPSVTGGIVRGETSGLIPSTERGWPKVRDVVIDCTRG
jgi:hypothetical protein